MLPDVKLKDYYLQFIANSKEDIESYSNKLEEVKIVKDKLYNDINNDYNNYINDFNIHLNKYKEEWIDKIYNDTKHLYNTIFRLIKADDDNDKRVKLYSIIKYCNILYAEFRYNKLIKLAKERAKLKFTDYRKIVAKYFIAVHKCVLEGFGYRFSNGIGTYVINHWKLDTNRMSHKPKIDFAATAKRKKELRAQGVKLYDDKEAAWYKLRNIPYDGIDYRIYKYDSDWYEFCFIKPSIVRRTRLEYQRTEYVTNKYRGKSYQQIYDENCKCPEDVYSLQVDIKYKLNMLLYNNPNVYLNFVRNAEQCKYKCRTNYSED